MALRQVYDDNGTLKSKDIAGSGSANAADAAYDNSNTGLPSNVQEAIDRTTSNISSLGTVELTATAAHAHAAGSTFLWIGQLVKATVAIAVGDTIAVGTNVENTDICSVLAELDSKIIIQHIDTLIASKLNDNYYQITYPDSRTPLVIIPVPQAPANDPSHWITYVNMQGLDYVRYGVQDIGWIYQMYLIFIYA